MGPPTAEAVTIIGAGLAGTTLAWALHRLGRPFLLVDAEAPVTSSRIAAGLMTPITGKRLAKSWRWDNCRPAAERFYRFVEVETDSRFFHPRPIVRLFTSELERQRFTDHREQFAGLVEHPTRLVDDWKVSNPFGGFVMPTAAQLDVATYLDASREWFKRRGLFKREVVPLGSLPSEEGGKVILCHGYLSESHPAFSAVKFRPAKGEILTVRIPELNERRILNRGGFWVAPTGSPDVYRVGATYSWHQLDHMSTPAGRKELEDRLRELVNVPHEVIGHDAAVRPIVEGQKPRLGLHPTTARLGYFNGLGSKGSLLAPLFAQQLAAYLSGMGTIDPEVDVRVLL